MTKFLFLLFSLALGVGGNTPDMGLDESNRHYKYYANDQLTVRVYECAYLSFAPPTPGGTSGPTWCREYTDYNMVGQVVASGTVCVGDEGWGGDSTVC